MAGVCRRVDSVRVRACDALVDGGDVEAAIGVDHDVVILGGSLAGSAAAWLLRERHPALKVLVIEKAPCFGKRVGEATVEVSGYFLGRVLGLTSHLNQSHLVKQGMRFWFANRDTATADGCSEIGGRYQVRLPAYQVDRSVLDEEMLSRAAAAGARVLRPAKVRRVRLQAGGMQEVDVEVAGGRRVVRGRWVMDATGFAAFLARQEGWYEVNRRHPTSAVWARWRGVTDLDGLEMARAHPEWAAAAYGIRSTATNHLTGDGWWAWVIPLKGGEVSMGVVYDQRRVVFSGEGSLGARLKRFLEAHPMGAALLRQATWVEGDVIARSNLAWSSRVMAGDGFVLVGDAAGFLDPFYSPGMDWLSFTVMRAVELVGAGTDVGSGVERYNREFRGAYERWFQAVYRDKYDYMGDFELMDTAFRLDLGLYYLGVVSQPFLRGDVAFLEPMFTQPPSIPVGWLMSLYNRRLAAMGRERRRRGVFGRSNTGRRCLLNGFTLSRGDSLKLGRGLGRWLRFELTEGWRTWFRSPREADAARASLPSAAAGLFEEGKP